MKVFFSLSIGLVLLGVINGQGSRTCFVNDDPHMTTFDVTRVDYHATCEFILAQACFANSLTSIGLLDFELYGQHDKCSANQGNWKPSCTKIIGLRIGVYDIKLQRNGASVDVTVNGATPFLFPFTAFLPAGQQLNIYIDPMDSQKKVMETSFGLKVYMRPGSGAIQLDNTLAPQTQNRLCGACGQHNYITGNDDFKWADGTMFNRVQQTHFAFVSQNFYTPYVINSPAGCTLDPRFDTSENTPFGARRRRQARDECSGRKLARAKSFCSIIIRPRGPFSVCLKEADSQQAYQDCINDMCINPSFGCANLDGYSGVCGQFGQLGPWRQESGCELECGPNQIYSTIASSECVPTCNDPNPCPGLTPNKRGVSRKALRNGNFEEGCMCIDGYVFNGNECVPSNTCLLAVSAEDKCQGLFGRKKSRCLKNKAK